MSEKKDTFKISDEEFRQYLTETYGPAAKDLAEDKFRIMNMIRKLSVSQISGKVSKRDQTAIDMLTSVF